MAIDLMGIFMHPLGPIIGYCLGWRRPGVRERASRAFDFQTTYWYAGYGLMFLAVELDQVWLGLIAGGIFVAKTVISIRGSMASSRGREFRYPLAVPITSFLRR